MNNTILINNVIDNVHLSKNTDSLNKTSEINIIFLVKLYSLLLYKKY